MTTRRKSKKLICAACGKEFQLDFSADDIYCQECAETAHCPYCHADANDMCEHYVGTLGEYRAWFPELAPLWSLGICKRLYGHSEAASREEFGELHLLLKEPMKWMPNDKELRDDIYDEGSFIHALAEQIMLWVGSEEVYWEGGSIGCASCCRNYFSKHPDDDRAKIREVLSAIEQSLKRLDVKRKKKPK